MAGLLDGVLGASFDDPRTAATLALAQGLLTAPKAMQGLNGGLLGYQNAMAEAKKAAQVEELRKMQMQQHQMALKQAERQAAQQAQQDAFRQSIPSPQFQTGIDALAANGGMKGALAPLPKADPNAELLHGAMKAGVIDPIQYITSQRKDNTPIKLGAGEALLDPKTLKPLFTNPKEDSTPSAIKEYNFAVGQGYKGSFQQFQTEMKRAGASSVSVNTGQKGLDNTLKLRGDFRSEPIYKAHQEMQSAHSQIKQALGQASPVGDLAGATKIMKLLDPGSVVRESELGMAMAATGLLDRVQNYASLVMSGQKLTPNQRKEFQTLADRLYAESVNQYNAKRVEYQGIAERNQLNTLDVLGPESTAPKVSVEDLLKKYGG